MQFPSVRLALIGLPLLLPVLSPAAVVFFDPTDTAAVPKTLSATGIYTNITTKALDPALKYFEVNAALWSDNAHKDRWIILPPGKNIPYVDTTDVFAYPESTIFVKLFRHDTVTGDSSSRIYWETRLLVKHTVPGYEGGPSPAVWHGFSYKWNKAGTEAYLVNLDNGFDTVVYVHTPQQTYRKWHFPNQNQCYDCHRISEGKRGVLGFFPAQLKRPSSANPSINQVTALFNAGVFSGTQPNSTALGNRFRGMVEGVPNGLSAADRFKVLDTLARSYIAANCSGCHGSKGLEDGATDMAPPLNYDFYNLKPLMEFGYQGTRGFGLDVPDSEMNPGDEYAPEGRYLYLLSLQAWGINTAPGSNFSMHHAAPDVYPALIVPGVPAYSTVVYRQVARRSPNIDSGYVYRRLSEAGQDPLNWKAFVFKAPWGTKAWRDTLTAHGVTVMELLGEEGFMKMNAQMPPLATFIPDTAALKILGEWATKYTSDSLPMALRGRLAAQAANIQPRIQNRMLVVPEGWTGKAVMTSLNGRAYALSSVGRNRYALPDGIPSGLYFFRIGNRGFRASVLR